MTFKTYFTINKIDIKQKMKKLGITCTYIAKRLGCSRSYISRVINDERICDYELVKKILNVFQDVTLCYKVKNILGGLGFEEK